MDYKKINNILGWAIWAIATFVYISTIESTASFWDCGEFIATAYNLEIGHPPGAPLFMLIGRFFSMFVSAESAGYAMNVLSGLSSSFTILFLFWSMTMLIRKMALKTGEITPAKKFAIFGSAIVGALTYTFSDSFWFSAVEAEVYALSSLFTALVFWAILKWEVVAFEKHSVRWIVFIAYLIGLSIGVHLLNLLAIPAMVTLYYLKRKEFTFKNLAIAFGISVLILGTIQAIIIPGTVKLGFFFELFFVNTLGMPFHSGLIIYIIALAGLLCYGIYYTQKKGKVVWNTIILCSMVLLIGFSTYSVIMSRSIANPPMDENNPENAFSLLSYLNREQYGNLPIFYGQYFNTPLDAREPYVEGKAQYIQDKENGKYVQINKGEKNQPNYDEKLCGFFPRMYSSQAHHVQTYKEWSDFKGKKTRASNGEMINKPTFGENLKFFFSYQLNHLYWRYFMWNFAGRQNDIQGHGKITEGNWISGIPFIDEMRLGNQEKLAKSIADNPAHNKYYMLPLLLGLLGMLYHLKKNNKDWTVVMLLFFFTGIAIIINQNQSIQPRERDYAYVGSFYAFTIWIAFGVYALFDILRKKLPHLISAGVVSAVCLLLVPVLMANQNWDDHNRNKITTASDFAKNYLNSCAPNAILFTNGDNDTFPLWYVQEVLRYRTDVRIVNLSLLNTDWYIEQMRRKAWDADGIPQKLPAKKLIQGTNDYVPIYERPGVNGYRDVDEIIGFVADDTPKSKVGVGQGAKQVDYIPTKKFKISVDKQKVLSNGTVPIDRKDRIVDNIEWTINKSYIMKNDLIILDILAANDWERPVYFAITTGMDSYLGLTDYFQLEGLAYRLVPYKAISYDGQTGEVNADIMYENLMTQFKWGGMKEEDIYMNENNRRMCMNFRNNFSRLASELIRTGRKEDAVAVLDECIEAIPERNVPYNYFVLSIAENYYKLEEYEKGNTLVSSLYDRYENDLQYYLSLKGEKKRALKEEMDRAKYILQQMQIMTTERYKEASNEEGMKNKFTGVNSLLMQQ
jgi:hypothetical protein